MLIAWFPMLGMTQLMDDFSDSSLLDYPVWLGDIDSFELANQRLHLNAPANSSESYLATVWDGAVDGEWIFDVFFEFNPSSSNKAFIYLMSSEENLKGPLEGYLVMLGNSADEVSLYKQDGLTLTKIIDGQDDLLATSQVGVSIKVTRDNQGYFELYSDTSLSGNWQLEGGVLDNQFMQGQYVGFRCDYTATRSDKFWFDNVHVSTLPYVDNNPPRVLSYDIPDLHRVVLTLDEALDSSYSYDLNHYILNNQWHPTAINYFNQTIELVFASPLQVNGSNELAISLQDVYHNQSDTVINFLVQPSVGFGQLRINEIYADETPSYGMPSYEFLELRNMSTDTIHFDGLYLADQTDTVSFPAMDLPPDSLLILCKTTAVASYSSYGACLGIPGFPSLNNTGDELILLDEYLQIIDSVHYARSYYQETFDALGNPKEDGGYSLERRTVASVCGGKYNWFPSVSAVGATPGSSNSVDTLSFPVTDLDVEGLIIENDTTLHVIFNDVLTSFNQSNCVIEGVGIEQAFQFDDHSANVLLDRVLIPNNEYTLRFDNLEDCYGQAIPSFEHEFFYFAEVMPGDLVINEILFNPHTGGVDFIEIYNPSDKTILLEGFWFEEYDVWYPQDVLEKDEIKTQQLDPKCYHVFTSDSANILLNYSINELSWLHEQAIPNLPDDEGVIVLRMPNGEVMDSVYYRSSWHLPTLDLQDGVSLERLNAFMSSHVRENWHSAAQTYGGATPTAENSQTFGMVLDGAFGIQPAIFSPDGNGYDDFCLISYEPEGLGEVVELNIYDYQGRLVRNLGQNQHVGVSNTWKWEGLDNNLQLAPIGIYVVVIESFDESGRKRKYRERVVLALPFH